jgi:hypothetical protein
MGNLSERPNGADLNGYPREDGRALSYEAQVLWAIEEGVKAGAIRRLTYPLMGPAPDHTAFGDCFFDWAELRAWAVWHRCCHRLRMHF